MITSGIYLQYKIRCNKDKVKQNKERNWTSLLVDLPSAVASSTPVRQAIMFGTFPWCSEWTLTAGLTLNSWSSRAKLILALTEIFYKYKIFTQWLRLTCISPWDPLVLGLQTRMSSLEWEQPELWPRTWCVIVKNGWMLKWILFVTNSLAGCWLTEQSQDTLRQ